MKSDMNARRFVLKVLALILFGAGVSTIAQTDAPSHPDLSGTWKLNVAKSRIPKGEPRDAETIYIDRIGSTILINETGDPSSRWQNFVTDGEQHVISETEGSVLRSGGERLIHVAYWKKFSLTTETIRQDVTDAGTAIPLSTVVESWTLSKDGRLSRETLGLMRVLVYDKTQ